MNWSDRGGDLFPAGSSKAQEPEKGDTGRAIPYLPLWGQKHAVLALTPEGAVVVETLPNRARATHRATQLNREERRKYGNIALDVLFYFVCPVARLWMTESIGVAQEEGAQA